MSASEQHRLALPPGYQLGKYRLREVLGAGGFGITYLADDNTLGRRVAIKELLPNDIATRLDGTTVVAKTKSEEDSLAWARERFVDEGRALAACEHPNVVHVYEMIEANGTAYMVTKYEEGRSLGRWLADLGRPPTETELRGVLLPLLAGLEKVHAAGFLHRDIKPENIYLTTEGRPVLLDFGSARQAITDRSMAMTSIVTFGYAPFEQYHEDGKQGAWSDIYALAAVLYRAITGKKPPEATRRLKDDPCVKLAKTYADHYSAPFLSAVDKGLAVEAAQRPQSIGAWRELIAPAPLPIKPDPVMLDPIWKKFRRLPGGFGLHNPPVVAALAVILLGLGILIYRWVQPEPKPVVQLATTTPAPVVSPPPTTPRAVTPAPLVRQTATPAPATPAPVVVVQPGQETGPRPGEKWQNSLGMDFVSVPGAKGHFSTWQTRVRDFEAFVKATSYDATAGVLSLTRAGWKATGASWKEPGFHQTPDHPVTGICAYDVAAFCQWLTAKERGEGLIGENLAYRLPTDAEWSAAAAETAYPWGEAWPPPGGAGNFASEEAKVTLGVANAAMISNYRDGYAGTAPVGTFPANAGGLFDLGGNVFEWCETAYSKELNTPDARRRNAALNKDGGGKGQLVLRGSSCFKSTRELLRTDRRTPERPVVRSLANGFRVLLAPTTTATLLPGDFARTGADGQPTVDPRLAGLWETRGAGSVRWEQRPDGTFLTTGALAETGRLTTREGRIRQYSDSTCLWTDVAYEFVDDTLVTTGPLGRAEWRRPGSATAGAKDRPERKTQSDPPAPRERVERNDPPPRRPNEIERKVRDIGRKFRGFGF